MGRAMVAVSITPVGTAAPGVSGHVAAALRVLDGAAATDGGLRYEVGPMFTSIEGDLQQVLGVVLRMQEAVFAAGARRVSTVIKVDERRDRESSMAHKVAAVDPRRAGGAPAREGGPR